MSKPKSEAPSEKTIMRELKKEAVKKNARKKRSPAKNNSSKDEELSLDDIDLDFLFEDEKTDAGSWEIKGLLIAQNRLIRKQGRAAHALLFFILIVLILGIIF